jgi:hypothetical protein
MAKSTKRNAQIPETPSNVVEEPGAVNTPSDAEVEHFGEGGAAGYLERFKNCTFLPEEKEELLNAFYFKITMSAFSDEWAKLWKEPDFIDDDAEELNPKWVRAYHERRWLDRALAQIEPLARKHGLDTRPLLWFSRYIVGAETLNAADKRAILDLISLLGGAVRRDVEQVKLPKNPPTGPFIPSPLQQAILEALDGVALKKAPLADKACGGEGTRLYRKHGINELKAKGLVDHKNGVGYYRPDSPPPCAVN